MSERSLIQADYPPIGDHQPDEPPLPMTVAQLTAVRDAAVAVADRPGAHAYDDFIIFHGPCRAAGTRHVLRHGWGRVFGLGKEIQDMQGVPPVGGVQR